MRLIGTIDSLPLTERFTEWLSSQGIAYKTETVLGRDWGSESYGTPVYEIWVIDEDQLDKALEALQRFQADPQAPNFTHPTQAQPPAFPTPKPTFKQKLCDVQTATEAPIGKGTLFLALLSNAILAWGYFTASNLPQFPAAGPLAPPINQELLYDWPAAYQYVTKAVDLYGVQSLMDTKGLPKEGQYLISRFETTPYWEGFYPKLLAFFGADSPPKEAPLFEKISQGEVWRLVTPILLHANPFHLLFNMLWLLVLGRQIEERIGLIRYFLFIIIAAIFSNTAQYLMSGSNFVGISGVIAAMLTFIWVRQKQAPWEGYLLHRSTFLFLAIFILAMLTLQVVFFFTEVVFNTGINLPIANTAHVAGAAIGWALGYLPLFTWNKHDRT